MNRMLGKLTALVVFGSVTTWATTIYSNTTTDTLNTVFFSVGPYSELGDQIHLGGTDRLATMATVQFFDNGTNPNATFDATLRFYQVGAPVGAQIGSNFVLTGISAPAGGVFNVTFSGLNTMVPNDLIFTVSLSNASANTDIGVDMFEPPTIGTSNNAFIVDKQGMSFSQLSTPNQNVFFQLDATAAVPEPGTLALLGCGSVILLAARKKLRKNLQREPRP